MPNPLEMTWSELSVRYCDRQASSPVQLWKILSSQKNEYNPEGWVLMECQVLDSVRRGELVIVPVGPNNTWHSVPTGPVSLRGLASDISTATGWLPVERLPGAVSEVEEQYEWLTSQLGDEVAVRLIQENPQDRDYYRVVDAGTLGKMKSSARPKERIAVRSLWTALVELDAGGKAIKKIHDPRWLLGQEIAAYAKSRVEAAHPGQPEYLNWRFVTL